MLMISSVNACPIRSLSPMHYRPDGHCLCQKPLLTDAAFRPKKPRVKTHATQSDRGLAILKQRYPGWTCSNVFVADYMPRFSATVILPLRRSGIEIEGRPCTQHPDVPNHSTHEFRLKPGTVVPGVMP